MPPLADAPFATFFGPSADGAADAELAELRTQTCVVRIPIGAAVIRREAAHRLLGDPRLASALSLVGRAQGLDDDPLGELLTATVLAKDGEDHARLRRLVARSFTPKAADRHRPLMRTLASTLADELAPAGRGDFVTAFADRYPIQVMCEVMGVPREHHDRFARWGDSLTYILSIDLWSHLDEVRIAAGELKDYLEVVIADRQARPRDDLVTSLVQASDGGDRLTPMELRAMLGGLLFAGYDTTRNQLGRAVVLFAQHPEQWKRLAAEPDLAPRAVNEVMRLASVVEGIPRVTLEDVDVDGWHLPAGTIVYLNVASANRDEAVFPDAPVFDITREGPPHLSFGGGPHYCLGANLARAEMEEALRVLAPRLPGLRLDGEVSWRPGTGILGPDALPIAWSVS